ncbi:MAG: hypothetical protein DME00_20040 [Candidatus Rokuibacteriota bacterium]|nr:MAG: hypothetical protein DME00_20040 [Candidatus Rokubacteria bacterium]PYO08913.1 MAG: hypothetical protein DMD75_17165 [Candidatus Rokubacteria bacterium]
MTLGHRRDLGDDDGAADGGDRVRRLDLDHLARLHQSLGDGDRDTAGAEIDRGDARHLGDRQDRPLTRGDRGLAPQQHADERAFTRRDPVPEKQLVLELQRPGLGERNTRHRREPLDGGHHSDPLLRESGGRQQQGRGAGK